MEAIQAFEARLAELVTLTRSAEAARAAASTKSEADKKVLEDRIAAIETATRDVADKLDKAKRLSLPGVEVAADENDRAGKAFSFGRMAKLCMQRGLMEDAEFGYEAEVYRNMRKAYSSLDGTVKAELNAGTGEGGAFLIPTQVQQTLIPIFREATIVRGLGATVYPGLVGNVVWTRQATDVTAVHIDTEASQAITTSAPKFERITMRPHVVAALVPITWEMRTQSSGSLEQFLKESIAQQIGLAIDKRALLGIGASAEPRGLVNHPDIQSFNWTATTPAYGTETTSQNITDKVIAMWKLVRKKSAAFGKLGWACSPDALARLSRTYDRDGLPIFGEPGNLLINSLLRKEYALKDSELLDDAADTGETLLFGNWNELVIGEWGTLAFAMTEFAGQDFDYMRSRLRGAMAYDVAPWHGDSFVKAINLAA